MKPRYQKRRIADVAPGPVYKQPPPGCAGKCRFAEEWQAVEQGKRYGHTPYFCPWCECWHLTSGR